jgi:DHA1 family multidrug resistance protein-like MFS transporter
MALDLRQIRRWLRLQPWQRNLYTILAAQSVALLGFSISIPFLPFYIQELGATELPEVAFWVGLINAAAPISLMLASPIWGVLADRFGRKPMLVRAMLGGSVILGLCSAVSTVPQLAVLRIIQGTLTGTVPAATTLVATSVPRERTGFSLGLLQTAIFAGHSIGPFVGGIVGGAFGYRVAFLSSGILLSLAGFLVLLLVQEEFTPPPPREQKQEGNALTSALHLVTAEPILATMVALLMLNSLGNMVTNPVLPLYVQALVPTEREASTATGVIVGATAFSNAIGAVWIGRSADRLGRRRLLLACLGIASLSSFPQAFTRHPAQLLLLRAIMGFAAGSVIPIANAVIAEWAPEGRHGGIYGISASLNAAGRAIGPMLGTIVVTSWSVGSVFPVTGALLGLVTIMTAVRTRSLAGPRSLERKRG